METQLAVQSPIPTAPADPNVLVVAEHPSELEAAQASLVKWAESRAAALAEDWNAATKALNDAKAHKWRSGPFRKVVADIEREQSYMTKMHDALLEGYCIVPNFPVDIIAIRIAEDVQPAYDKASTSSYKSGVSDFEQTTDALTSGEGRWVAPLPKRNVYESSETRDGKAVTVYKGYPNGWQDPRFPIHLAKPRVLDATQRAMALKCFDRIGVLPGNKRKVDPIVVGQIMRPIKSGSGYELSNRWHHNVTTFLIAWFIDTKDLG